MIFLNFLRKSIPGYLAVCLSILFILNISPDFSNSPKNINKSGDQNVVFLDFNYTANILTDNTKPGKRIFEKTTCIDSIRNYSDNTLNVVFRIYHSSIRNNLSRTYSSRQFIPVQFSTDI